MRAADPTKFGPQHRKRIDPLMAIWPAITRRYAGCGVGRILGGLLFVAFGYLLVSGVLVFGDLLSVHTLNGPAFVTASKTSAEVEDRVVAPTLNHASVAGGGAKASATIEASRADIIVLPGLSPLRTAAEQLSDEPRVTGVEAQQAAPPLTMAALTPPDATVSLAAARDGASTHVAAVGPDQVVVTPVDDPLSGEAVAAHELPPRPLRPARQEVAFADGPSGETQPRAVEPDPSPGAAIPIPVRRVADGTRFAAKTETREGGTRSGSRSLSNVPAPSHQDHAEAAAHRLREKRAERAAQANSTAARHHAKRQAKKKAKARSRRVAARTKARRRGRPLVKVVRACNAYGRCGRVLLARKPRNAREARKLRSIQRRLIRQARRAGRVRF